MLLKVHLFIVYSFYCGCFLFFVFFIIQIYQMCCFIISMKFIDDIFMIHFGIELLGG